MPLFEIVIEVLVFENFNLNLKQLATENWIGIFYTWLLENLIWNLAHKFKPWDVIQLQNIS